VPKLWHVFIRPFPTDQEVVTVDALQHSGDIPDRPTWSVPAFTPDRDRTWARAVRAPRINHIINQHFTRPLRLLDVGAQDGIVSLNLDLPQGSSVDLMQFDSHSAVGNERPNVRQFRGLLQDLRGSGYKADVILALHVLEHVDEPQGFLTDIRALLSDDGISIIEVPYELQDGWATAANRILSWNHKSFFAPWSVLEAVRLSGLQVVEWELMDCHHTSFPERAPSPGAITRVTVKKADVAQLPIYPTGYGFVRSLDRLFGNFAGSLAYLTEKTFSALPLQ
jgi:Methyltransferase domain